MRRMDEWIRADDNDDREHANISSENATKTSIGIDLKLDFKSI